MALKEVWEQFGRFAEAMETNPLEGIDQRLRRVEAQLATLDRLPTAINSGDQTDGQQQQVAV